MSLRLRIEHGQDAGKTVRLPGPGVYTLGRKTDVSLRVLDMKVSGDHCEIRVAGEGGNVKAVLHDLHSTHGCLLNGQPVKQDRALNPGDELRLGMTILRVLSDGDADADIAPAAGRTVDDAAMSAADARQGNTGETKQTLPPDQLVGKDLGGYQIERKIGAGGMGGVYLAEQTSLKRKVALKVLNESFAADSAFVDQFVNEARAAGALNHPNVVQVYDVGSAEGHYYFSMEVMPGGSIEDKVREGPIEWPTALNWFIDASNALIFANRREILHRDVKPDNLMIGEDESAKLCDLGLAKKSEVSDLMDQGIIGTPHFISPEAVRRKADIDHRTDLYSLGCSFYRIFTGKNPFPGTSVKEILLGHLNKPVPHINELNRDVPHEIDEVVAKLMAKDPDERYQTPEELLRALDKIRTQYNLEAHGIKPASKKPLIIGAAAAVIAIGIAIFIVLNNEDSPGEYVKTPEELQAELDAQRAIKRGELETSKLSERYSELSVELATADLEENWQKPVFGRISKDLKALADAWDAKAGTWREERGQQEDTAILGYYDEALTNVAKYVGLARKDAKKIDETIEENTRNQKAYETLRKSTLAKLDADVKTLSEKLAKFLTDKKYIELETTLTADDLGKMVTEALAAKVGKRAVIKQKDVTPILDKYIPGNKDGKERGKAQVKKAVAFIDRGARAMVGEARALLGEKPGHEAYIKAVTLLNTYLEGLPAAVESAPIVSAAYTRARKKAGDVKQALLDEDEALKHDELRHDKPLHFDLINRIWAPREAGGFLQRFEFVAAHAAARNAVEAARDARYKKLAQEWQPPIEALAKLFEDIVAAYPDGWAEKYYLGPPDKRDRRKKLQIKAIDATGLTLGKEKIAFQDLGPRWLLDNLFFYEDGKMRLKTCSPDDHYGLAVLAEMAIDYDLAGKQYMAAAAAYGDAPNANVIRKRLGKLPTERQAAEKFAAVRDFVIQWEKWAKPYEDMVEEQALKPDAFPPEERAKVLDERKAFYDTVPSMHEMRDALLNDAALAGTFWGSALRTRAHAQVAYAGETLPPPERKKPPRKNDGEEPGKKKPDDKKKDGKKKDGKKKSDGDAKKDDGAPEKDDDK